jgi:hypothetical protein
MSLIFLPASTTFTPEQALHSALQDVDRLDRLIIIGTYPDDDLFIRSSRMTCAEALWLVKRAERYTLNPTG